jgi:hypothetical protein
MRGFWDLFLDHAVSAIASGSREPDAVNDDLMSSITVKHFPIENEQVFLQLFSRPVLHFKRYMG